MATYYIESAASGTRYFEAESVPWADVRKVRDAVLRMLLCRGFVVVARDTTFEEK